MRTGSTQLQSRMPASSRDLEVGALMDQLAQEAQAGALVPFLGAGVSLNSKSSGCTDFTPSVQWLSDRIWELLCSPEIVESPFESLLRHDSPLSKLSEIASWLFDATRVVDSVCLRHFTELNTLSAHRYIARMAREGWIREIVTVNYDTCIERAWRATFRHQRRNRDRWPAVIVTGENYLLMGRPSRLDDGGPEPTLRLYKINGCAADWLACRQQYSSDETKMEEVSQRIKLTDPQLANPDTPWKLDLLRDRMRSRRLVYSGFGGEEAQIRYTFLSVDGEGHSRGSDASYQGPVVHVFGKKATFYQLQLLSRQDGPGSAPDVRGLITGSDGLENGDADRSGKLSADDFWRVLYRHSMVVALVEFLEPAGAFRRRLTREGHQVGARTLEPLRRWLEGPVRCHGDQWYPFDEFGSEDGHDAPSLLVQAALHAARGRPNHVSVAGADNANHQVPNSLGERRLDWQYYRPLLDDAEVLCCVLFLLMQAQNLVGEKTLSMPGRDEAGRWAVIPVVYRECCHRAVLVDSDVAMEDTWFLHGIRADLLPSIAVDLGYRRGETISIQADVNEGGRRYRAVYNIPCIRWSDLLPSRTGALDE